MKEKISSLLESKSNRLILTVAGLGLAAFIGSEFIGNEPKKAAPKVKPEKSIVFDVTTQQQLDQTQQQALYTATKKSIQLSEANIRAEKEAMSKDNESLRQELATTKQETAELRRMIELIAKNNVKSTTQNNQYLQKNNAGRVSRASQSGAVVPTDGDMNSPSLANMRRQTQIITQNDNETAPETKRMIRTITQRSVQQIKQSGQVEETPIKVSYINDGSKQDISKKTDAKTNPEIAAKRKKGVREKAKTFIPSGSIISGVLINGVAAPTALSKNASPLPVTIRVKLDVIAPNNYRMDLEDCNIIGAATGDLASERVYIRSATLSCINQDGEALETSLKAYASSKEDGGVGIRGDVVSRSGKAILATMGASFFSALATATKPQTVSAYDTSGSDTTTFQTPNAGSVAGSAAFGGVAGGGDRLAKYWTEIADQQWPVIEVSAGRAVDFIVESGMSLPVIE